MLRSMYSGISGMKANQTKLDVIGNNIANVNTTSFKSSRATFSDLLSQTTSSAQASSATKGGVNGKQVGLGVQLASIDRIMTQGSMQSTSRSLDVGIDGNGYFMVSTGPVISSDSAIEVSHKAGSHTVTSMAGGTSISYTRDGSFTLDNEGNLLTTDGYRVLGYSLTNDDSTQAATGIAPSTKINIAGFTFSFSAGTQLNGTTVRLGQIGSGTATSASLTGEGNNKILTINGDFSNTSSLTAAQIQQAINNELAAKGISQTAEVVGNLKSFANIGSETEIKDGSDASAPDSVSCFNLNFTFEKGGDLNNKKIVIEDISASQTSVRVDGDTIKISGNFLDGRVNTADLKDKMNTALLNAGYKTQVKNITGNGQSLSALKAELGGIENPLKPTYSYENGAQSIMGFTIDEAALSYGKGLDGYKLKFVQDDTKGTSASCDISDKTITLTADFTQVSLDTLNNEIDGALSYKGIDMTLKLTGAYDAGVPATNTIITFNGGKNATVPKVNVGGFTINLPSTDTLTSDQINKLNQLKFKVVDINGVNGTEVRLNGTTIEISGNFTAYNGVQGSELGEKINDVLNNYLNAQNIQVNVTGDNTVYNNSKSDAITGGTDLEQGSAINALGLNFQPSEAAGATFNGYKIAIGDVNGPENGNGKVSVSVNKESKVIKISANFAGDNAVTADDINNELKKQLQKSFGDGVYIGVTETRDNPISLSGQTSGDEKVEGGTSIQSIKEDGTMNYVSASTTVYSYDSSLKTLKIPESVTMPDGSKSAVKSYSISDQGVITATLENGKIAALGQIALANFSNPAGLTSNGGNLYSVSANSGDAVIRSGINTMQDDNSQAYGSMLSGYLEMSNVDLAEQFTDMITTTKAFQGAAKMITTGDDILTEIINLKR